VSSRRYGTVCAAAAYLLWGLFPLYWPLLKPAGAFEILAHRIVWSLVVVGALLAARRRLSGLRTVLADRRRLGLLLAAAVVISVNWATYIWGVNHHQVVETSLGYFINPLVTLLLGVVVLGERLRPVQWWATGGATIAVAVLTWQAHRPPWLALVLAASFGSYALLKKKADVGAVESLTVETGALLLPALLFLAVLEGTGHGTFTRHGVHHAVLLGLAGVVTAVPLVLFGAAATRVPLSTLGLLQYLAPTVQFLLGVLRFGEPLPAGRLVGFVMVWTALAVFTYDAIHHHRRQMRLTTEALF
jgi:chloramphenicol-sensitive protein RarD